MNALQLHVNDADLLVNQDIFETASDSRLTGKLGTLAGRGEPDPGLVR
jgi:hypothetical protein